MHSNGSKISTAASSGRPKSGVIIQPRLNGFVFTERLGSGTYATVYKAYKKSSEQREVLAIKCIKKSSLNRTAMENLLVEIEILKQIDHPHIVKMLDFQWDSTYIYIIMEYCAGGDLSRFISTRRMLPEYIVKRFLQQIASALQLLHDHNISHMDLKPQNILLTSEEQPVLKLADFGFAQYLDSSVSNGLKGSPLYMAPEIITLGQYNAKVDLWSIGVILYECLFGRAPFASKTFVELENKIKSDRPIEIPTFPRTSDNCSALLYSLLQRNPDDRISFEEFFLHPFVDLQHKPSPECITKATSIVREAVAKDKEGKREEAAKLYSDAIEYFVPAIYYESDKRKKDALRKKVNEYFARAEQLRSNSQELGSVHLHTSSEGHQALVQLAQKEPKIQQAIQTLSAARQKETEANLQDAMTLYEQAIEVLLSHLTDETDPQLRKQLQSEIQTHLHRAESIREKLQLQVKPESPKEKKPHSQSVIDAEEAMKVQCDEKPNKSMLSKRHVHPVIGEEESTKKCTVQ